MKRKRTTVRGETVTVYSLDGVRWFSDKKEAEQCRRRLDKLLAESKRSLKRQATFAHETRGVGRR